MIEKNTGTASLHELYAKLANSVDAVIAGTMDVKTANAVVGLCATATKVATLLLSYQRAKTSGQIGYTIPALESRGPLAAIETHERLQDEEEPKPLVAITNGHIPRDVGLRDFGIK
jgi:hypothetical protein